MCGTSKEGAVRLLLCLLSAYIPAVMAEQNALAAPQNISMVSINMKHLLTWSPVTAPGGNVTYCVQVQGEFERTWWDDSWPDEEDCTRVSVPWCDITKAISANVFYSLRVRADLGPVRSEWATLEHHFNQATTLLTTPTLKVRTEGHHLFVELEELGPDLEFWLVYWRKDNESLVKNKTVKESRTPVHLETVEAGMEYCVKAQSYVPAINRRSNFSLPVCVPVSDVYNSVLTIGLISLFAFILAIIILPFLAWKTHQMLHYSCCPAVTLPQTLIVTDSPRKLICPKNIWLENHGEDYAVAVRVVPSEERQHLRMQETI